MTAATTGDTNPDVCPECLQPYQYSYREGDLRYVSIYGYRHEHLGRVYVHEIDVSQTLSNGGPDDAE